MDGNNTKGDQDFTKANRIEALFKAAEFWWGRYDQRLGVVWKIHFTLWTALAAAIGILLTDQMPYKGDGVIIGSLIFGIVLLVLHIYLVQNHARMNSIDRRRFDVYYEEFKRQVDIQYPEDLEEDVNGTRSNCASPCHYASIFVWSITLILAVLLVLAASFAQESKANKNLESNQQEVQATSPTDSLSAKVEFREIKTDSSQGIK